MTQRVRRTRNMNTITESQYWGMVRSALRGKFRWWKPAIAALNAAKEPYKGKNKRAKWSYACAACGKKFLRKDVEIHHRVPVGSLKTAEDLPTFIKNLTPESPDAYAILCKPCHRKANEIHK